MNNKVEKILEGYCKGKGYEKWKDDDELFEILRECCEEVQEKVVSKHRWWNIVEYIVKAGDTFLSYVYADNTGEMSPSEAGYEFDPDTIQEMEPIQKTVTTYVKKG